MFYFSGAINFLNFSSLGCRALITTDWMPTVFLLYNAFFFLALFWSLATPQNSEPVQLAAIINLLSILLDLMCIATNYGRYHFQDWFGFSLL